jgi:hypothetical protein
MTSRDFCFWLQGHFEMEVNRGPLTGEQVECIRNHLALVFKHEIDPSMGPPAHQAALNAVHTPPKPVEKPEPWQGGGQPFPGHGPLLRC